VESIEQTDTDPGGKRVKSITPVPAPSRMWTESMDTFIAINRFMAGEPPLPWWRYTKERKRTLKTQ